MQDHKFSRFARYVTEWSGSSYATLAAFAIVLAWTAGGILWFGFGEAYQMYINSITTVITFLMVFLIQHTQNHDTKAMHKKLDELIRSIPQANNGLVGIEELDDIEIDKQKDC